MQNKRVFVFLFVFIALIFGGLASSNTSTDIWYQNLNKASLNPPGYIFGIVWPVLYLFMSISAYRTFDITYKIFYIQLFLNAIWSWLFFYFHLPLVALIDIYLLIFINIRMTYLMIKDDLLSSILYIPYVIWLLFASYLNVYIVFNN